MNLGGNKINIAGFYAVDKFLSRQEISGIIDDIYLNNDLFDAWCGHDCEPGYSIDMSTMTCKLCPASFPAVNVTSGHYCNGCTIASTDQRSENPAFACLCNGVSNLNECSCIAGTPSPLVGTSNELALLRNRAQFESRLNRFSIPRSFSGMAVFDNTGGFGPAGNETSAVGFDLNSHVLNAGTSQMKIGTNGFTAVAVFKFTGIIAWARILEFGKDGSSEHNLNIMRINSLSALTFEIRNGWDLCKVQCDQCIVQDQWQTLVAQYNPTTSVLSIRVGDTTYSATCLTPRADRTFPNTRIGRGQWAQRMLGKIAGFYAVDKFLSRQEVSGMIDDMYLDNDPFDAWCGHDCQPGYSVDMFSRTCKLCPAGLPGVSFTSGHYCNGCTIASTDTRSLNPEFVCFCDAVSNLLQCSCAAGYTGNGLTCTAEIQCPGKDMIAFVEHRTTQTNAMTKCMCTNNAFNYDAYGVGRPEVCRCNPGWTD